MNSTKTVDSQSRTITDSLWTEGATCNLCKKQWLFLFGDGKNEVATASKRLSEIPSIDLLGSDNTLVRGVHASMF